MYGKLFNKRVCTGFGYAQIAFWTVLSLISILDTTEEALISLVIPYLRCEWNLSLFFEGAITCSVFLFYGISKYATDSLIMNKTAINVIVMIYII